eukprot:7200332-Alexandrium_andersonii.AAC.1
MVLQLAAKHAVVQLKQHNLGRHSRNVEKQPCTRMAPMLRVFHKTAHSAITAFTAVDLDSARMAPIRDRPPRQRLRH